MKRFYTITIGTLILLLVVLEGANIFVVNTKTTEGITAGELTQKLAEIEEKNIELESNLLSYASFRNVASKAAELGLSTTREFVSLYDPVEVASIQ